MDSTLARAAGVFERRPLCSAGTPTPGHAGCGSVDLDPGTDAPGLGVGSHPEKRRVSRLRAVRLHSKSSLPG